MIEIIWVGRGGQGAFTAAKILGTAYSVASNSNQALVFPSFGPERRGAPIRAFTRLDKAAILNRSEIQAADYIVVLENDLLTQDLLRLLKPTGVLIVNAKKTNVEDKRIQRIDATDIAQEVLKIKMVNTTMLSYLNANFLKIPRQSMIEGIKLHMNQKVADKNEKLLDFFENRSDE